MTKMKNTIKWLLDGYLFWVSIILIILPFIQNNGYILNRQLISSFYLIAGSICLIIVLLKNIKKLFKENIFNLIKGYLYRCPLIKKHYVLAIDSVTMKHTVDEVKLSVKLPWKTQKERLAEIERQITQIKQQITEREKYLQDQMDIITTQIKQLQSKQEQEVEKVSETISVVVIGDYKLIILSAIFTILGIIFS
jgi:hypothetical protein